MADLAGILESAKQAIKPGTDIIQRAANVVKTGQIGAAFEDPGAAAAASRAATKAGSDPTKAAVARGTVPHAQAVLRGKNPYNEAVLRGQQGQSTPRVKTVDNKIQRIPMSKVK